MLVHASIDRQPSRDVELILDNKLKLRIDGKKVFFRTWIDADFIHLLTEDGSYYISSEAFERVVGAEWDLGADWEYLHPDGYLRHDPTATVNPTSIGTFTIGHLLSGAARPTKAHGAFLYIIRDDDVVLYAGQTTIPVHKRINQHTKQGSLLGQHFRDNVPASYGWQVEVLEIRFQEDLDRVERDLILDLRPTLNIHHNLGEV